MQGNLAVVQELENFQMHHSKRAPRIFANPRGEIEFRVAPRLREFDYGSSQNACKDRWLTNFIIGICQLERRRCFAGLVQKTD